MADFVRVASTSDIPRGQGRMYEVQGRQVAVFNVEGQFHAVDNVCEHQGGPLAEGELDESTCTVECPRHGSLFDLRSGRPKTLPAFAPVEPFPGRAEDGQIKLEVD